MLNAAGCERTFTDHASGTLARRPALDEALSYLRAGDTLVVTKLDCLGRSVRNLKQVADDLQAGDVALRALSHGIDTPGGRLFFHMLAAIAEFEHDLIVERTVDRFDRRPRPRPQRWVQVQDDPDQDRAGPGDVRRLP